MIVAVMSDTHLDQPDDLLAAIFERHCREADVLLHCGDCVSEETWSFLNSHPRFYSVQGNCDLSPLNGTLPVLRELELEGFRLGMGHGWGPRSRVGDVVAGRFQGVDIVCYGHTHIRDWRLSSEGVRLLNPGSLFWPRSGEGGMARLHLTSGQEPEVEWITI
ncbi:putative phosphoesterase [Desulfomicrobium macestii]|uniref:Phosphoesterase n=1 Tax=Desulfomicrobium macestii TaxID=90731 RepID=A0ABR9H3N6_9BACT|nr:metallophosphoesterase family protein [Desulfomicrobium macestii]MBE1425325.1 putative phosphoesterase [Desulfomicrobium macestii]